MGTYRPKSGAAVSFLGISPTNLSNVICGQPVTRYLRNPAENRKPCITVGCVAMDCPMHSSQRHLAQKVAQRFAFFGIIPTNPSNVRVWQTMTSCLGSCAENSKSRTTLCYMAMDRPMHSLLRYVVQKYETVYHFM